MCIYKVDKSKPVVTDKIFFSITNTSYKTFIYYISNHKKLKK